MWICKWNLNSFVPNDQDQRSKSDDIFYTENPFSIVLLILLFNVINVYYWY